VTIDHNKNEVFGFGRDRYYKVCVSG